MNITLQHPVIMNKNSLWRFCYQENFILWKLPWNSSFRFSVLQLQLSYNLTMCVCVCVYVLKLWGQPGEPKNAKMVGFGTLVPWVNIWGCFFFSFFEKFHFWALGTSLKAWRTEVSPVRLARYYLSNQSQIGGWEKLNDWNFWQSINWIFSVLY